MVTLLPICYISQLKHLEINAKAREAPIIHKAKTIESLGIKKRDELKSLCNPYHVTSVYYFTVVYILPWVPEVFFSSASECFVSSEAGRHVFGQRPMTETLKPHMKSLWIDI